MNQLDVYYRALSDYRQNTIADHHCTALRSVIAEADAEQDKLIITRSICFIDRDWVDAIESGLIHVEKALKEERQFIRSNGEVIPIEKVKHVSKESVEHLAKHSNLISRYEEDADIVPDQLYTVERLNDYTVYENRFLYMLLCYLRDFVTLRYNDILDLTNRYEASLELNKKISMGKQKFSYAISMNEIKRDDAYLKANNPARDMIDRIDLILKTILAFLSTPLMEEVSKTAMLKPPVTKTNVLKLNNNFKGAMALYEFIIAYDKPGYRIEKQINTLAPFKEDLADEMAEVGCLISFLSYEYGLGIKQEFKKAYDREEERRKAAAIKQRAERIAALKRRLGHSGTSIEDYVLLIEGQLRDLQGESERAETLADSLGEEKERTKRLTENIVNLNEEIEKLGVAMEELRQAHFEEICNMQQAHEAQIKELEEQHNLEILQMEAAAKEAEEAYALSLANAKKEAEEQIEQLKNENAITLDNVMKASAEKIKQLRDESELALSEAKAEYAECHNELMTAQENFDTLLEEKRVADARIKALVGVDEDYTEKQLFDELEQEYIAFAKIYKQQWAKTKKQIKKNVLDFKKLRGQKEIDGEEQANDSEPG